MRFSNYTLPEVVTGLFHLLLDVALDITIHHRKNTSESTLHPVKAVNSKVLSYGSHS